MENFSCVYKYILLVLCFWNCRYERYEKWKYLLLWSYKKICSCWWKDVSCFVLVVVVSTNKDGRHAPLPPTVQKWKKTSTTRHVWCCCFILEPVMICAKSRISHLQHLPFSMSVRAELKHHLMEECLNKCVLFSVVFSMWSQPGAI